TIAPINGRRERTGRLARVAVGENGYDRVGDLRAFVAVYTRGSKRHGSVVHRDRVVDGRAAVAVGIDDGHLDGVSAFHGIGVRTEHAGGAVARGNDGAVVPATVAPVNQRDVPLEGVAVGESSQGESGREEFGGFERIARRRQGCPGNHGSAVRRVRI